MKRTGKIIITTLTAVVLVGGGVGAFFLFGNQPSKGDSSGSNKPGHSHEYTTTIISPTCSAQGYTLHTCECGEQFRDTYVNATGKHVFNDYFANKDATCLTDGTETARCVSCTLTDTRVREGSATGHVPVGVYTKMYSVHWQLCKTCGKHVEESHKYDKNNKCTVCDYQLIPEPNLRYELSYDRLYYSVRIPTDIGVHNLVIPGYYEGKPVRASTTGFMGVADTPTRITFAHGITSIGTQAFTYISNLKEVIIPDTVTEMGMLVFQGSDNMTDIWCEAKSKPSGWNSQWMGNPIIYMNPAKVHWGDEWHYVHGVPVLNSETNVDEDAHVYSTVWTTDSEYHWYEPICGHDVPIAKIKHDFDKDNLCTVCHYVLR